mgnify:CR=1 FL=1
MVKKKKTTTTTTKKDDDKLLVPTKLKWWSTTSVKIDEPKDLSVETFIERIKGNQYLGFKSDYLIGRDICHADSVLEDLDFATVCTNCGINKTTVNRYKSIGRNVVLDKMFTKGVIPRNKTVLLLIVKQPEHVQNTMIEFMYPDISKSDCTKVVKKIKGGKTSKSENNSLDFFKFIDLKLKKGAIVSQKEVTALIKLVTHVKKLPFVHWDETLKKTYNEKIKTIRKSVDDLVKVEMNKKSRKDILKSQTPSKTHLNKKGKVYKEEFEEGTLDPSELIKNMTGEVTA